MFKKENSVITGNGEGGIFEITATVLKVISGDVVLIRLNGHVVDPTKHGYSEQMESYYPFTTDTYEIYSSSAKEAQYIMDFPDLALEWIQDNRYTILRVVEELVNDEVTVNAYHVQSFVEFVEMLLVTNTTAGGYNGYLSTPDANIESYTEFLQEYDNEKGDGCIRQYMISCAVETLDSFYYYITRNSWATFGENGNCKELKIHYNNQVYDVLACANKGMKG